MLNSKGAVGQAHPTAAATVDGRQSKISQRLAVLSRAERLVSRRINRIGDEANRRIAEHEVSAAGMIAADRLHDGGKRQSLAGTPRRVDAIVRTVADGRIRWIERAEEQ